MIEIEIGPDNSPGDETPGRGDFLSARSDSFPNPELSRDNVPPVGDLLVLPPLRWETPVRDDFLPDLKFAVGVASDLAGDALLADDFFDAPPRFLAVVCLSLPLGDNTRF